jgi:VanZ family protein
VDKPCRWPLIVAALIAYGSLYPFGFALPASFGAFWNELLAQRRLWTGLGDVAGNVLLFIPLGAAAVLCVGARQLTVLRAAQVLLAASAFSFAVQVLQAFEPSRDPALSDVLWNAVGTGAGIGAGFALERYVALLPRAAWARSRFAVLLIAAWTAAELWPFVPSLDWYAIKQTLKPLLLAPSFSLPSFVYHFVGVPEPFRWIPFQALLEGSMSANVRSLLAQLFAFGAMLWLVERAGARLPGAAAALALWVGLIEVAQMWIVGRTPDITPALLVIAIAIVLARLDRGEALARGPAVS